HHARGCAAAANVDLELRANCRRLDRQVREADGFLEKRRLCAAGYYPLRAARVCHITVAGDSGRGQLETDELSFQPGGLLPFQRLPSDEVRFLPADDPFEIGF